MCRTEEHIMNNSEFNKQLNDTIKEYYNNLPVNNYIIENTIGYQGEFIQKTLEIVIKATDEKVLEMFARCEQNIDWNISIEEIVESNPDASEFFDFLQSLAHESFHLVQSLRLRCFSEITYYHRKAIFTELLALKYCLENNKPLRCLETKGILAIILDEKNDDADYHDIRPATLIEKIRLNISSDIAFLNNIERLFSAQSNKLSIKQLVEGSAIIFQELGLHLYKTNLSKKFVNTDSKDDIYVAAYEYFEFKIRDILKNLDSSNDHYFHTRFVFLVFCDTALKYGTFFTLPNLYDQNGIKNPKGTDDPLGINDPRNPVNIFYYLVSKADEIIKELVIEMAMAQLDYDALSDSDPEDLFDQYIGEYFNIESYNNYFEEYKESKLVIFSEENDNGYFDALTDKEKEYVEKIEKEFSSKKKSLINKRVSITDACYRYIGRYCSNSRIPLNFTDDARLLDPKMKAIDENFSDIFPFYNSPHFLAFLLSDIEFFAKFSVDVGSSSYQSVFIHEDIDSQTDTYIFKTIFDINNLLIRNECEDEDFLDERIKNIGIFLGHNSSYEKLIRVETY